MPRAKSCTPENNVMAEARKVKPGTADPPMTLRKSKKASITVPRTIAIKPVMLAI
jgi:hypothetical protein